MMAFKRSMVSRRPKISEILWAVIRQSPRSQAGTQFTYFGSVEASQAVFLRSKCYNDRSVSCSALALK